MQGRCEMLDKLAFLSAIENRETFFERIAEIFSSPDYRYYKIEEAYNFVKEKFRGKFRDGGERYFEHLRMTALIAIDVVGVEDHVVITACLLHDVLEDTDATEEELRAKFGDEVTDLVLYLSKPDKKDFSSREERNVAYHSRFILAPLKVVVVKLSDRFHNITTLWECTSEKRTRIIVDTKIYYLPLAKKNFILYHELKAAVKDLESKQ